MLVTSDFDFNLLRGQQKSKKLHSEDLIGYFFENSTPFHGEGQPIPRVLFCS